MEYLLEMYVNYLAVVRGASENTRESYYRDLKKFFTFCKEEIISDITRIAEKQILAYLMWLKKKGLAERSVARHVSALKGFYRYL